MVEIFKTDVIGKTAAKVLLKELSVHFPGYHFNFDLQDCDRILRVQSGNCVITILDIIKVVKDQGVFIKLFIE